MTIQDWIALAGTVATFAAVFVAIWGDKIRSWLFRPGLSLELQDPLGELIVIEEPRVDDGGERQILVMPARYYHVVVRNKSRFPVAHEVQVLIKSVEWRGPAASPAIIRHVADGWDRCRSRSVFRCSGKAHTIHPDHRTQ
jgi:hypothetical protein